MAKKTFSKIKLEERILNELNLALRSVVNDPRLKLVSITKVTLNGDFSEALCQWDSFDMAKRGDSKKAILGVASRLRSILSQKLEMRHTPALKFKYDDQFECEQNITELLNSNLSGDKTTI